MRVTEYSSLSTDAMFNVYNCDDTEEDEKVHVCIGTYPMLRTLRDAAVYSTVRTEWTLFLINVSTLIRNNFDKKYDTGKIADNVVNEIETFAETISAYVSSMTQQKPVVCFYFPHYEYIPEVFRKKFSSEYNTCASVLNTVRDKVMSKVWSVSGYPFCLEFIDTGCTIPHTAIISDLCGKYPSIKYGHTLLITHAYIDFHLGRTFNNLHLLESFTGKIKSESEFVKKVIGKEDVPFNKYTHLLFGDKLFIKAQLSRSKKRDALRIAKNENWCILSESDIKNSIVKHELLSENIMNNWCV